jgi:hypothetical protein
VRLNGYWRPELSTARAVRVSSRSFSPSATRRAFRDRLLGARSHPERRLFRHKAYDLSPSERTRRPMSKIDRHSDLTSSREEQRILTRALGCGVEELVARFGAESAIKRVETELRRARRARSRKLHTFWSSVLIRIETETDEQRNRKPAQTARHMAAPDNDARAQD